MWIKYADHFHQTILLCAVCSQVEGGLLSVISLSSLSGHMGKWHMKRFCTDMYPESCWNVEIRQKGS